MSHFILHYFFVYSHMKASKQRPCRSGYSKFKHFSKPYSNSRTIFLTFRRRFDDDITRYTNVCYLTAPSHYLKQCWLILSEVFRHSLQGTFTLPKIYDAVWSRQIKSNQNIWCCCRKYISEWHTSKKSFHEGDNYILCMHAKILMYCGKTFWICIREIGAH